MTEINSEVLNMGYVIQLNNIPISMVGANYVICFFAQNKTMQGSYFYLSGLN
jgi:hypothetical protein